MVAGKGFSNVMRDIEYNTEVKKAHWVKWILGAGVNTRRR